MEFVLNEYHRNVPDEDLIEDLKRVAGICQKPSLTQKEYLQYGKYASGTIVRRFGSWNKALKKAGLVLERGHFKTHFYCESDELFFEDVRAVATRLGQNYVSIEEYAKYGKYSHGSKLKKYKSWDAIMHASGLESTPFRTGVNLKYTDEELFEEMERLWIQLGRQPSISDAKLYNGARISGTAFQNRFGSWRKALEAFVEYINADRIEEDSLIRHQTVLQDEIQQESKGIHHRTKREVNLRMRFKVMERDNFKCCICGRSPSSTPGLLLHIDHIKPWSKGGETVMENLRTLCQDCNLGKSDLE
jgi:hypothetical protein